ncbi:MAG: AAA family ATPase [Thermoguttaceae bacterium]|jgi:predicted ATPase
MRIQSIEANNFKSLVDFKLDLVKFNCLIGLNGSGKSTVLQFIDFLSQLVRGDVKGWLGERHWKSGDLKSKLTSKKNIKFFVRFANPDGAPTGHWEATFSPSSNRCIKERFDLGGVELKASRDSVVIKKPTSQRAFIPFDYEGSVLSAFKEELLPPSILECKKFLYDVKSLDLLDPEHLRYRTKESSGTLGLGGKNLSAFVHEMSDQKRQKLVAKLRIAYPQLQGVHAKPIQSGWKQIEISESYEGSEPGFFPSLTTEARHVNDGMLRLMAILAELQSEHRFVLFDEIENGINPELVEFVIDNLVNASQQVLVTTHSPMILNYLDDQTATAGVIYLYKTPQGHTKSIPFFSIPSLAKKLTVMGPGEAFVDTNLTQLASEIAEMAAEEA